MNSIRPLATITILVVVGVFLYTKINEGPALSPETGHAWGTGGGVPGLQTPGSDSPWNDASTTPSPALAPPDGSGPPHAGEQSTREGGPAPAWAPPVVAQTESAAATSAPPAAHTAHSASTTPGHTTPPAVAETGELPSVPQIPDLPPLPSESTAQGLTAPASATNNSTLPATAQNTATPAHNPYLPNGRSEAAHNATDQYPSTLSTDHAQGQDAAADYAHGPAVMANDRYNSAELADDRYGSSPQSAADTTVASAEGAAAQQTAPSTPTATGSSLSAGGAAVDGEPPRSEHGPTLGSATPEATPAAPSLGTEPAGPASGAGTPASAQGNSPNQSSTSAYLIARPAIQAALERGELPRAQLLLTHWYGNKSLTDAQQQEVETLLSQLAGTVIYSTEHRLEPPYVVQPGETLESIAQKYEVPWQLLAKINGIARSDLIQPGSKIKVVRGPFMASVNLSANELILQIDGRYAGRFTVSAASNAAIEEGEWRIEDKLVTPGAGGVTPASTPQQPAVDRMLVLRSASTSSPDARLTLGSAPRRPTAAGASEANLVVAPGDAEELCDILSVGSRVVIRR